MSDNMIYEERRRNRELQQEEQQNLHVNPYLQENQNLQDYQNQQADRNAGMHGNVQVNLPHLQQGQVQIQSNSPNPEQPEPMPKYIGFNKAYVNGGKSDNKLMTELRMNLKKYFESKEDYEKLPVRTDVTKVREYLEECMETLNVIQALCEQYRQSSLPVFFGKSEAIKKKQEVALLSSRISDEITKIGQDYVTVIENEFASRAQYDKTLRKRSHDDDDDDPDAHQIRIEEGNKLNLDEWNKEVHFSDYEQRSVKSYLRMRCRIEGEKIVGNIDYYSNEEMGLFNRINEYAQIEDIGRKVSGTYRQKKHADNLYDQQHEYKLYSEIMMRLKEKIADPAMPLEKKRVFESFHNMMAKDTKGTLTLPPNTKVADFSNLDKYKISQIDFKADGTDEVTELKKETKDRKGDPLFAHVPCVSDIAQNLMGNCYLLSSIAGLVEDDPKTITDMFMDEGDNVVVRLYHHDMKPNPNAPGNFIPTSMSPVYIRINKTVDQKTAMGAFWVNLLCKAFSVYVQKFNVTSAYSPINTIYDRLRQNDVMKDPDMIDYGFINMGGLQADAIPILTGKMSGERMILSGEVHGTRTPRDLLIKECEQNNKKMVVPITNLEAMDKFKNQETAVFEYNSNTYIYHKNSHKGLLSKIKDNSQRMSYLTFFSAASDRIMALALVQFGKDMRDVIYDPDDVEKIIDKVTEDTSLGSLINQCGSILQNAGINFDAKARKDLVKRMKDDAIRTMRESCKSSERMNADDKTDDIFTGEYTDEAIQVYDKINEWRAKKLLVGAGSRITIGKKKSITGNETEGAGTVGKHAYTVLGTMKMKYNGKIIRMVRVRNPWGRHTTSYRKNSKTGKVEAFTEIREDNGEFLMELTHFVQTFNSVHTTSEN